MKPLEITDEDMAWCEEHVAALMKIGVPQTAAYELTVRVRAEVILARRQGTYIAALEKHREQARRGVQERDAAIRAKERAEREARATQAQRPTLTATLGDRMKAKEKKRNG